MLYQHHLKFYYRLYPVVTRIHAKLTHFKEGFRHLRHPLRLLTQQAKEVRRFRKLVGVLGGKQLKLSLHKRKRSAKFVGGISGELPLGGKALVKTVEHTVERYAELSKLRQSFLGNLHICQVNTNFMFSVLQ